MHLSSLQTFIAIVETGSLIRASEQLNVTQSTVTARLKTLEENLGQTLIHRNKTGATLTAAGLKFKRYAEVMTQLWRQAKQETSLPEDLEALCNIAIQSDCWTALGHKLINQIYATHPNLALSVWSAEFREIDRGLATGLIDIALTNQPSVHENQTLQTLYSEPLILVSDRPDSPTKFDPGYVYIDAGEEFGRRHAAAYADADTARVSYSNADWGLDHLLEHGGSAYLPVRICQRLLSSARLYRVADAAVFERNIYITINNQTHATLPWLQAAITRFANDLPAIPDFTTADRTRQ